MRAAMLFLALLLVVAGAFMLFMRAPSQPAPSPVERGKYLVTALGCDECHSPKRMTERGPVVDESKRLSGAPSGYPPPPALDPGSPWGAVATLDQTTWAGPWGVSRAANLTPDEETGLGVWSEEVFIKALRAGKHMGVGRPILPPMPAANYGRLSDEDLKAVYAFLRSLPPIKNAVPPPDPPAAPSRPATPRP